MRIAKPVAVAVFEDASKWTVKDVALLALGAMISFYATVVFERYKRFGEILREVARNRELSLEYLPDSKWSVNLELSYRRLQECQERLAECIWNLEADGHLKAAGKLARLRGFIWSATCCVDRMMNERTGHLSVEQFLEQFKTEYQQIFDADFQNFETQLHPSWSALLRPYPHPAHPESRVSNDFDYFHVLLNLPVPKPKLRV
jgi:hypothetical protein